MGNRIEQISHSLDLDEQIGMHRTGWITQIFGKILILAFMVLGLLGLFGEGWLSKKQVQAGGAQVRYERFLRHDADTKMHIALAGVTGFSAVSFPLNYIRDLEVHTVIPQPERSFIKDGQVWYVFEAEQNLQATFYIRPKTRGNVHGSVWVNEAQIPLHHFIYP